MGSRNQIGNWLAHKLRAIGLPFDEAKAMLTEYEASVPQAGHPYTQAEALQTLASLHRGAPTSTSTSTRAFTPIATFTPAAVSTSTHRPSVKRRTVDRRR